jgi:hypothetical protein
LPAVIKESSIFLAANFADWIRDNGDAEGFATSAVFQALKTRTEQFTAALYLFD